MGVLGPQVLSGGETPSPTQEGAAVADSVGNDLASPQQSA